MFGFLPSITAVDHFIMLSSALAQAIVDRVPERGRLLKLDGPRSAPSISALTLPQGLRQGQLHRPEFPCAAGMCDPAAFCRGSSTPC
jgi:hypothetical protein